MKLINRVGECVGSWVHAGTRWASVKPEDAATVRPALCFKSALTLFILATAIQVEARVSGLNDPSEISSAQTVVWNSIGSNGSLVFNPVSLSTKTGVIAKFSKPTSGAMRLATEYTASGTQLCLNSQDSSNIRIDFDRPVAAAGAEVVLSGASSGLVTLKAYGPDGRLAYEDSKNLVGGQDQASEYMGVASDSEEIATIKLSSTVGVIEVGSLSLLQNAPAPPESDRSSIADLPSVSGQNFEIFKNGSMLTPQADISVGSHAISAFSLVKGPTHAAFFQLFPDGTFAYRPEVNYFGKDSFLFEGIGIDGHTASLPAVATIDVAWINSAPTFTGGPDQTSKQDSGSETVQNWATQVSPGTSPLGQPEHIQWIVNNDQPMLFAEQPRILEDGTLTYRAAPQASGLARVTVWLKNDGGEENGGKDTSAPCHFAISIEAVAHRPMLGDLPEQTIPLGEQMSVWAKATVQDTSKVVVYSIRNAPKGMEIDPLSGLITWTPGGETQPGSFDVAVKAEIAGEDNLTDERELRINVVRDALKPELRPIDPIRIAAGSPVKLKVETVATGRHMEYFLGSTAQGASIDATTGLFTWTPGAADANKNSLFLVTAFDMDSGQMTPVSTFTVAVTQPIATASVIAQVGAMQHAAMHFAPVHHRRHHRRHRI